MTIQTSNGREGRLQPQSVAEFFTGLMAEPARLDVHIAIHRTSIEVAALIPFDRDEMHPVYEPKYANRFWRMLLQTDRVFKVFRARITGKCSPARFFWGIPHSPDW